MIVHRWQAPTKPTLEQVHLIFESEGLDPVNEIYNPAEKVSDHRHPFKEVRFLVDGEMLFKIAGTQLLLRAGDRIEIPANTKHSHIAQGTSQSLCVCSKRVT
jgi:quercetin dioxygenase-like cupin family protein